LWKFHHYVEQRKYINKYINIYIYVCIYFKRESSPRAVRLEIIINRRNINQMHSPIRNRSRRRLCIGYDTMNATRRFGVTFQNTVGYRESHGNCRRYRPTGKRGPTPILLDLLLILGVDTVLEPSCAFSLLRPSPLSGSFNRRRFLLLLHYTCIVFYRIPYTGRRCWTDFRFLFCSTRLKEIWNAIRGTLDNGRVQHLHDLELSRFKLQAWSSVGVGRSGGR